MLPRPFLSFIRRHHVLTLATRGEEGVHCCNLFYAWLPEQGLFAYTSDMDTIHARQALADPGAAASVVLETRIVGRVQGLQMRGRTFPAEGTVGEAVRRAYLARFPYAAVYPLEMWAFEPHWMKLTDNTLGFGKKLIWTRDGD